eukprot:1140710-Pelagomonas_calceolata.AAC.9
MLMLIVDNTIADTYACFEAFNTKCRALGQAHLPSSRNTSKEGGLLPLTGCAHGCACKALQCFPCFGLREKECAGKDTCLASNSLGSYSQKAL